MDKLIIGVHGYLSGPMLLRTPYPFSKDLCFKVIEALKPLPFVQSIYLSEDIIWLTPASMYFSQANVDKIEQTIKATAEGVS